MPEAQLKLFQAHFLRRSTETDVGELHDRQVHWCTVVVLPGIGEVMCRPPALPVFGGKCLLCGPRQQLMPPLLKAQSSCVWKYL